MRTTRLKMSGDNLRNIFSFSLDTPDAGAIVRAVINQHTLRTGGGADWESQEAEKDGGKNRKIRNRNRRTQQKNGSQGKSKKHDWEDSKPNRRTLNYHRRHCRIA